MSKLRRFNEAELSILREIIAKRQPGLLPLVDNLGPRPLTKEQREELRGALADEFLQSGLMADDEPNTWGLKVDDLIGRLMHY
jgi:hypothetical protein